MTAMPLRQGSANARVLTDAEVDAALRGTPCRRRAQAPPKAVPTRPCISRTTRVNDAQPMLLATGEDRQNIDLRLERVRLGRIDGSIATGDGQPLPPNVTVFLSEHSRINPQQMMSTIRVGPDGRFGLSSAPGSFTLVARTPGVPIGQFGSRRWTWPAWTSQACR